MHQTISADTTGPTLRRARELAALRERPAARALGIRRSRLRDWESGAAVPDADEMARAIELYSADLRQIWPDRQPLASVDEPGVLVVGDERIDVRTDPMMNADGVTDFDNRVVLSRYLAAVRRQRGLTSADPIELRASDLASLAAVLDLDDAALESELMTLLDLTPAGARWATRVMVVGGLMTIAATAVVGSSWFAGDGAGATTVEAAAPAAIEAMVPPPAAATFAPEALADDAPVDAEVVSTSGTVTSPFSTEPSSPRAELAPAVFAVAPATEWSVGEDEPVGELPSADPTV